MKKVPETILLLCLMALANTVAALDFTPLEKWVNENERNNYNSIPKDRIVAETATHFVVAQDGGHSCPAGFYWLFNKLSKSYQEVRAGTCNSNNLKLTLLPDKLIFMSGNTVTAQYPTPPEYPFAEYKFERLLKSNHSESTPPADSDELNEAGIYA